MINISGTIPQDTIQELMMSISFTFRRLPLLENSQHLKSRAAFIVKACIITSNGMTMAKALSAFGNMRLKAASGTSSAGIVLYGHARHLAR